MILFNRDFDGMGEGCSYRGGIIRRRLIRDGIPPLKGSLAGMKNLPWWGICELQKSRDAKPSTDRSAPYEEKIELKSRDAKPTSDRSDPYGKKLNWNPTLPFVPEQANNEIADVR